MKKTIFGLVLLSSISSFASDIESSWIIGKGFDREEAWNDAIEKCKTEAYIHGGTYSRITLIAYEPTITDVINANVTCYWRK